MLRITLLALFVLFTQASQAKQSNTPGNEVVVETGMLLVLDPDQCLLAEGCGPTVSLLDESLENKIVLTGIDIEDLPSGRDIIVSVTGYPYPIHADLAGAPGYEGVQTMFEVDKLEANTSLPYRDFLIAQATQFTLGNYGCKLTWNKSYSWVKHAHGFKLSVTMTNTRSMSPKPFLMLTFDAKTGERIGIASSPDPLTSFHTGCEQ